jgi:tRNA A-37 threonylcarbamoyl transferase component Bud32
MTARPDIVEIYRSVREALPSERSALLQSLTSGDPDLRRRIESMLGRCSTRVVSHVAIPKVRGPAQPELPGLEILQELGAGGMGIAYLARDKVLQREVVLKTVLDQRWDQADVYALFEREAAITAQLQLPGVPPVFRTGKLADGRPYLLMKRVGGASLEDLLAARSDLEADHARFLAIFAGLCSTMAEAHERGIAHRDLKPLNIFVEGDHDVLVLDWGLAKNTSDKGAEVTTSPLLEEGSEFATPGPFASPWSLKRGTPGHLAPEALSTDERKLDRRSDVFSLGVMLTQILQGSNPLKGIQELDTLLQAIEATRTSLGAAEKAVELHRLAAHCLAADPDARPASAGAVASVVLAYQRGVAAARARAEIDAAEARGSAKEARRTTRAVFLVAMLVLGFFGVGAYLLWNAARESRLRNQRVNGLLASAEAVLAERPEQARELAMQARVLAAEEGGELEANASSMLQRADQELIAFRCPRSSSRRSRKRATTSSATSGAGRRRRANLLGKATRPKPI